MSMGTIGAAEACEHPRPMAKELGNTVRRYPHKLARLAKISIQKVLSLTLTKESGPEEDIGACTDDPEHSGAAPSNHIARARRVSLCGPRGIMVAHRGSFVTSRLAAHMLELAFRSSFALPQVVVEANRLIIWCP